MPFSPHLSSCVVQQYKYRDLTVREITNVISQYKDLKPVMDAYGKLHHTDLLFLTVCLVSYILFDCMMVNIQVVLLVDMRSSSISVFNDGSTRDLMSLTGTVPVSYRGNKCLP